MTQPTHGLDPNALEAAPVAWRWRTLSHGIASGWFYSDNEPSFAPYDLERIDGLTPLYALSQNPGTSNTSGEAEPVAWRWRFPPGGWHYASEKPEFAPYDAERVHGPFPMYAALEPRASDRERTIEECARIAHKAHLTYAQLRDTHRRDTLDWAQADASTKAAAAIWHAIGDLLPRDPNDPTEAAIRKLSEVSHG